MGKLTNTIGETREPENPVFKDYTEKDCKGKKILLEENHRSWTNEKEYKKNETSEKVSFWSFDFQSDYTVF